MVNRISHNGQTHEFSTTAEFLALPIMRKFTDDPAVSHLAQGGNQLQAIKLIEGTPVMHVIGTLAEPVVLPKTLQGRKGLNP